LHLLLRMSRSFPSSSLCPYTTLFRSGAVGRYDFRFDPWQLYPDSVRCTDPDFVVHDCAECRNERVRKSHHLRFRRHCSSISLWPRSEEHTSELQSRFDLVCRLLLEKKNQTFNYNHHFKL